MLPCDLCTHQRCCSIWSTERGPAFFYEQVTRVESRLQIYMQLLQPYSQVRYNQLLIWSLVKSLGCRKAVQWGLKRNTVLDTELDSKEGGEFVQVRWSSGQLHGFGFYLLISGKNILNGSDQLLVLPMQYIKHIIFILDFLLFQIIFFIHLFVTFIYQFLFIYFPVSKLIIRFVF